MAGYKWREIVDLPLDIESLRDRELEALIETWVNEKTRIPAEQIQSFNDQLAREWAIETGIIEGVYTLDRGITQTLIERESIHRIYRTTARIATLNWWPESFRRMAKFLRGCLLLSRESETSVLDM